MSEECERWDLTHPLLRDNGLSPLQSGHRQSAFIRSRTRDLHLCSAVVSRHVQCRSSSARRGLAAPRVRRCVPSRS
jgi:hypothetical protein